MKIGTKSVLFGAHQFMTHPWFVAWAWWKLYGFPFDPRLWVAFFVHDIGYLGKPNMDGPEGEGHVFSGATIMGNLFDYHILTPWWGRPVARLFDLIFGKYPFDRGSWYSFCFYHSRFMAKKYGVQFSPLCVADKLAITLTPAWLYLPMVNWSGEIHEYMAAVETKYASEALSNESQREWFDSVVTYLQAWVDEHKDGREDTWTPEDTTRT